jgi:glycosyltransferase involved in cell wall biosynthesis
LAELARSHAVLCLLDDLPGAERIYPAKIFEIMYVGRPCLTLAPEGALADLVREYVLGDVIPPRDSERIFEALSRRVRDFRDRGVGMPSGAAVRAVGTERFHRKRQAGEFARIFREATEYANDNGAQSSGVRAAGLAE